MVKKIFFAVFVIILTLTFWIYMCFCKFNQIGIDTYTNDTKRYDPKFHIKNVIANYPKTMFLYKGREFQNIPCHEFRKEAKNHKVNIVFNWDNTITYMIDNKIGTLVVDSINIATCVYVPFDTVTYKIGSEDSMFYSISLYDKNKNMIKTYRQKSILPYGGKRNGFSMIINNMHIVTGNISPFDY